MGRAFLTRDCALHGLGAAALTLLFSLAGWVGPAGTVMAAIAASLLFFVREMEQAAEAGERWKPGAWSMHRHAEWIAAVPPAFLVAAGEILYWHFNG